MKYIALRHDTLEGAGPKKETLEVDLGDIFNADPEHPQIIRALRVGSIQVALETSKPDTGKPNKEK